MRAGVQQFLLTGARTVPRPAAGCTAGLLWGPASQLGAAVAASTLRSVCSLQQGVKLGQTACSEGGACY